MRNGSYWMLPLIVVTFGAALLSKENAIIFLLLGPVTLYLFKPHDEAPRLGRVIGVLGMTAITYLIYRGSVIGWDIGSAPREMMNNPFIKIEGNRYVDISVNERISTILYALGRYIQLLFVPHPLSHDYYPRVWGDLTLLTPAVVASSIMQITLLLIAVLGIRRRSFISYCIIFFYLSIGLVANVLFPIGTYMSERFLFTPSLAVCLLGGYAFVNTRTRVGVSIRWGLFAGLLALFSIKTITRNTVWQDDFTLFTTDVHTSPGSAKVQNAAGGALVNRAYTMDEGPEKTKLLNRAIHHLNQAIEIHPNYKNAHLLLGNANSHLGSYDQSIYAYDNALLIDPYYDEASTNLLIVLREAARYQGQTRKDYIKATTYLKRSLDLAPDDHETNVLMGVALGSQGKHREAVTYFEKAIQINPEAARGYVNLGYALLNLGDEEEAQIQFQQAISIDPTALDR
ncbi:MAG: tetratricopeptide repeat protein, partial [Bacteroidota bacterium]